MEDLCSELMDPTTAQPARTSAGQVSAWKHWKAWCAKNNSDPWRLHRVVTDTDFHREAVLQAGFLRFCHIRQSARPRGGRKAALVSSAIKTLCHIRKMHKDRDYPMISSALVTAQTRRLNFEYKRKYGVADMVKRSKEPFTRQLLVDVILGAPALLNFGFCRLNWTHRHGRSLLSHWSRCWHHQDEKPKKI